MDASRALRWIARQWILVRKLRIWANGSDLRAQLIILRGGGQHRRKLLWQLECKFVLPRQAIKLRDKPCRHSLRITIPLDIHQIDRSNITKIFVQLPKLAADCISHEFSQRKVINVADQPIMKFAVLGEGVIGRKQLEQPRASVHKHTVTSRHRANGLGQKLGKPSL